MKTPVGARALGLGSAILAALGCAALSVTAAHAATLPPQISVAFQPNPAGQFVDSRMTLTVVNPNALSTHIALTGVNFTDTVPKGLEIDTMQALNSNCTGTAAASSSQVSLSGALISAAGQCSVTVFVAGLTAGPKKDSVLVSSDQGTGNTATAALDVIGPLTLSALFTPTWIPPGGRASLKFTIGNPNDLKRTKLSFSDALPAGLRVATPKRAKNSCGGTVTAAAGSAKISLSGGTIAPSSTCSVSVVVTGTGIGAKNTTTSQLSSKEQPPTLPASAEVSVARPGDRVFWTNPVTGGGVSFADLAPGNGGGDLTHDQVSRGDPFGVAIDSALGRAYYGDLSAIPFAKLDGSGAGLLSHPGATSQSVAGVAIDPAAAHIYWANRFANTISFSKLDGSGGGNLKTGAATVNGPDGVAIDPAAGLIFWANSSGNSISFAKLNDSGQGGNLNTSGATVNDPEGVAIDAAAGKIYWANASANVISFARLDGTGGGDLPAPSGAVVDFPNGLAIDHTAGLIYWANGSGSISFAHLNGNGGGAVDTNGASVHDPGFPALLKHPAGLHRPSIKGRSRIGATLRCSTGSWAPDDLGAFLYRAPQHFGYQWSRDGRAIAGATKPAFKARRAGSYRCTVTASNGAGSTAQRSRSHAVT